MSVFSPKMSVSTESRFLHTCTWYWWSNCFDFGSGFNENWKTNMNKSGFSIKFVLFIDLPIKPENGQNGQHWHNPSYLRVWYGHQKVGAVESNMHFAACMEQWTSVWNKLMLHTSWSIAPQLYLIDLCLQDSKEQEGEHKLFSQNFSWMNKTFWKLRRLEESKRGKVSSGVAEGGSCQQLGRTPYEPSLNTLGQLLGHPGQLEGAW